jgi:polar amino acid transport system substrate-binding protein
MPAGSPPGDAGSLRCCRDGDSAADFGLLFAEPETILARILAFLAVLLGCLPGQAVAQAPPEVVRSLAPGGRLRAAINFGNPVLAQKDPADGTPRGVSVELARELARRLGVPLDLVTFDGAGQVFDALKTGAWDLAFLAIDPVRAAQIDFSPPYVVIEGTYLVPANSPLQTVEAVDRPGIRVAVGRGSAYDLYLTRAVKSAQLVRADTSAAAIALFESAGLDAVAGVRQPLMAAAKANPNFRVLSGRFMTIEQAMGTPKGRDAGALYLRGLIEEMKSSGFVAKGLAASGQTDATVAPPAPR